MSRAGVIYSESESEYNANLIKISELEVDLKIDTYSKFINGTKELIENFTNDYRNEVRQVGVIPKISTSYSDVEVLIDTNPIIYNKVPNGEFSSDKITNIYKVEAQKACEHTSEMLKQLGFNITKTDYASYGVREYPGADTFYKFAYGCNFVLDKKFIPRR